MRPSARPYDTARGHKVDEPSPATGRVSRLRNTFQNWPTAAKVVSGAAALLVVGVAILLALVLVWRSNAAQWSDYAAQVERQRDDLDQELESVADERDELASRLDEMEEREAAIAEIEEGLADREEDIEEREEGLTEREEGQADAEEEEDEAEAGPTDGDSLLGEQKPVTVEGVTVTLIQVQRMTITDAGLELLFEVENGREREIKSGNTTYFTSNATGHRSTSGEFRCSPPCSGERRAERPVVASGEREVWDGWIYGDYRQGGTVELPVHDDFLDISTTIKIPLPPIEAP